MNVSVKPATGAGKKHLVAERDFEAGETIYKEDPIVTALDPDILTKGTYCTNCLRHIETGMAISTEHDSLNAVYCSKECQLKSKLQSQNLLFGLDSVLPAELDNGMGDLMKPQRAQIEAEFASYIKAQTKSAPLLTARIVARQIAVETAKLMPGSASSPHVAYPYDLSDDYGLSDHMERLRLLNVEVPAQDTKLLCGVLAAALPGLESSLTAERHAQVMGKVTYNAIGVCYAGGRDDKPPSTERPEDQERTRTPYGTSRQIGSGIYLVSSYIAHSCSPNARPSFSSGTAELSLIATRPIKKGDEITMAYVDVSQHPDETPVEARRRRRIELARGWRFKCECALCTEEAAGASAGADDSSELGVGKDESTVEDVVKRVESGAGPEHYQDPE